jgi:hypothetical protein
VITAASAASGSASFQPRNLNLMLYLPLDVGQPWMRIVRTLFLLGS